MPDFDKIVRHGSSILGLKDPDLIRLEIDAYPRLAQERVWQDAEADLRKLIAGWRPDITLLSRAPMIHDWRFFEIGGGWSFLVGSVTDHPKLGDRPMVQTSVLLAMDMSGLKWARTRSRFYRLGNRHPRL